jgi:hypothetical protein
VNVNGVNASGLNASGLNVNGVNVRAESAGVAEVVTVPVVPGVGTVPPVSSEVSGEVVLVVVVEEVAAVEDEVVVAGVVVVVVAGVVVVVVVLVGWVTTRVNELAVAPGVNDRASARPRGACLTLAVWIIGPTDELSGLTPGGGVTVRPLVPEVDELPLTTI